MADHSEKKSRRISPFVDFGRDGSVQVRLGQFLRSDAGKLQRNELKRIAEIIKGRARPRPAPDALGN